jgi:hypothetical protein
LTSASLMKPMNVLVTVWKNNDIVALIAPGEIWVYFDHIFFMTTYCC